MGRRRTGNKRITKSRSARHSHLYTIADEKAVEVLVRKLGGSKQGVATPERLREAVDAAAQHYKDSNRKVRQAFFHGLLTGYGVGLKLR
jgi:hypothetical protein